MSRDEIRASILYFFEVIEGEYLPEMRELNLKIALDRLALAVHLADYTSDEGEAPTKKYEEVREMVSPRFPDCGFYNVALDISTNIGEGELAVGDAIDDICDIAGDLEEVLWCWENTSIDDALWHFKESYGYHWGKHLRDLQLYLYAKELGW